MEVEKSPHKIKTEQNGQNNHFEILKWTKGEKTENHWFMKNCQNLDKKMGTAAFLAGVVCIPHSQRAVGIVVSPGWGWLSKPAALLPAETDLIWGRGQEPTTSSDARKMSKLGRKQIKSHSSWAQDCHCCWDEWMISRPDIASNQEIWKWEKHSWLSTEKASALHVSLPRMATSTAGRRKRREQRRRPQQPCRKPTFQRCPPTQAHLPSQTKAFQSAVFEQTFDQLLSNYQSMQTTG